MLDPVRRPVLSPRRLHALALALAPAVVAGVAYAQPTTPTAAEMFPPCTKTPTKEEVDGAGGAHRAAKQYFERSEFDKAISYWRDAYGFDCTRPKVLQNVASAYEKKGELSTAAEILKLYLTRVPNADDSQSVSEKIVALESASKPAPTTSAAPTTTATTTAPPPTATATAPPPPPSEGSVAPWVVAGAGGVVLAVGVVLLPIGYSKIASAEDECPLRNLCPPDVADEGNMGRTLVGTGWVLAGVGAAALAAGVVWGIAFNGGDAPAEPATGMRLVPVAGPSGAGLDLRGRF